MPLRHYDPATGRMTGIDPMASSYLSESPYSFAGNNPVYYNDPSGGSYTDLMQDDVFVNGGYQVFNGGGGYIPSRAFGWANNWSDQFRSSYGYTSTASMIRDAWNATPEGGISFSTYDNGILSSRLSTTDYFVSGDGNGNGFIAANFGGGVAGTYVYGSGRGDRYAYGPGSAGYDGQIHMLAPAIAGGGDPKPYQFASTGNWFKDMMLQLQEWGRTGGNEAVANFAADFVGANALSGLFFGNNGRGEVSRTMAGIEVGLIFIPGSGAVKTLATGTRLLKVAGIGANRISHIMQTKHAWQKLMANPTWSKIQPLIDQTLVHGTLVPYKGVSSRVMYHNGFHIQVTFKELNGVINVSDAWVITR
ncbi:hypothetical protein C900_05876 [Fulvivirga imtechensis AK7]|uniref:Bacterial toxin 35 domain-containing protein n=2 Tax=Fulvivirga TaxID=396811 RepID=L8JMP6_9BACT|nr:hypothetical protein C900_05876 [Fulvivirga imtechensis AK7]